MDIDINEIFLRLDSVQNKKDLYNFVTILRGLGVEWQENLNEKSKEKITEGIREKSLTLIYEKGDVPDRDLLWACKFFENVKRDERFQKYIDLSVEYAKNLSVSPDERLLFVELVSVSQMLLGESKEAIKFFCSQVIYLPIHETYMDTLEKDVKDFLWYLNYPIESILEIQKKALKKENFFALDDKTKKSIFLWSMHIFWNVKHYFNDLKWRENYPIWREVLKELLECGNLDLAMYVEFYIYHKFGNSAQTQEDWQQYNDEIVKLVEPYFVEYGKNLPKCKEKVDSTKKIRIGILKERIVENSPYKVVYSFCKALLENKEFSEKYEIKMYVMGYVQKSFDSKEAVNSFLEIGVDVVNIGYELYKQAGYYYSHLQRANLMREEILKDGVNILISCGPSDCADFLFCTRSAPRQIFWSHGNDRYDIKGIDERITHCSHGDKFFFKKFAIPMDVEKFYNPPHDPKDIEREKAKYPITKDTVVLGVIGRLVKVDSDEYLECIAEVMKKHKNTIFIAAGAGNDVVIREKVKKLGISERFYMPGFVDAHIYGHIIDIFCNTFPMDQGESLYEFRHKKRSYITLFKSTNFLSRNPKLTELKKSDRALVYIKNLGNFTKDVENYDKFVDAKPLFITNKKVKLSKEVAINSQYFDLSDDDMENLGDYSYEIKDKKIYQFKNNCVVDKNNRHFINYCENNRWYWNVARKIDEYAKRNGHNIFECTWSRSIDGYKSKLSKQIENKYIRDGLNKIAKMANEALDNHNKEIFIEIFLEILS